MDTGGNHKVTMAIVHAIFALCGGVVREMTHGRTMSVTRFLTGGIVGTFTGMVVFCLCQHFGLSDMLTGAATAMGGYTGTPLLDLGSSILRDKIGGKFPDHKD